MKTKVNIMASVLTLVIAAMFPTVLPAKAPDVFAVGLKCNMMADPVGIGNDGVFLSWMLDSDGSGVMQTAYRIQAGSSEEDILSGKADKWDSGWVKSSETVYIPYEGKPLASGETCYWRVQVKTNAGRTGVMPSSLSRATIFF